MNNNRNNLKTMMLGHPELSLTYHNPGDGVRYRIHSGRVDDFHAGDGLFTSTSAAECITWLNGYRTGRRAPTEANRVFHYVIAVGDTKNVIEGNLAQARCMAAWQHEMTGSEDIVIYRLRHENDKRPVFVETLMDYDDAGLIIADDYGIWLDDGNDGYEPDLAALTDNDNDGLTREDVAEIEADVRAEQDTVEAQDAEIEWMAKTYLGLE